MHQFVAIHMSQAHCFNNIAQSIWLSPYGSNYISQTILFQTICLRPYGPNHTTQTISTKPYASNSLSKLCCSAIHLHLHCPSLLLYHFCLPCSFTFLLILLHHLEWSLCSSNSMYVSLRLSHTLLLESLSPSTTRFIPNICAATQPDQASHLKYGCCSLSIYLC